MRTSVLWGTEDEEQLECITKTLYPVLARRYRTSAGNVERSIRYAINAAWKKGDAIAWEQYYGVSRNTGGKKPSNSALIATLADKMRLLHYHSQVK